jgi:Fe2+ transport system protein FeoA
VEEALVIAMYDQLQANLKDLAPVLWSYMTRLMELGFTREESLALVRDMQGSLVEEGRDK